MDGSIYVLVPTGIAVASHAIGFLIWAARFSGRVDTELKDIKEGQNRIEKAVNGKVSENTCKERVRRLEEAIKGIK